MQLLNRAGLYSDWVEEPLILTIPFILQECYSFHPDHPYNISKIPTFVLLILYMKDSASQRGNCIRRCSHLQTLIRFGRNQTPQQLKFLLFLEDYPDLSLQLCHQVFCKLYHNKAHWVLLQEWSQDLNISKHLY